jgi:hypothetical protein
MIGKVSIGTVALLAMVHVASAQSPPAPEVPLIQADRLTKKEFDRQLATLPDTTIIQQRGQRHTVGEIRARLIQRQRDAAAKRHAAAANVRAAFEDQRAKFLQAQQAKLQADNAKAAAELARLRRTSDPTSPEREAIQHEVGLLLERSRHASAVEQVEIEKRAGELLTRFRQLSQ